MRRLLTLLLCALSGASWGFKPTQGTDYVIVTPSELPISDVGGKTIDCALWGPSVVAPPFNRLPAGFDCTNEPHVVSFEPLPGSSTSWYISMVPGPRYPTCYLHEHTVNGVPKNQFEWACTGKSSDGSVFQAKDQSNTDPTLVALKGDGCGLHGSTTQLLFDGWNTSFYATGDCANPWSHTLTVLTKSQFNDRLNDRSYTASFGSDGCSAGTSDRWNLEFRPSCTKHDNCYTNPWGEKNACDTLFLNSMKDYCKSKYDYTDYVNRQLCLTNADLYYVGVQAGGQSSYDGDQQMLHNEIINGHRLIRFHTDY